jgi:hypothetical protein
MPNIGLKTRRRAMLQRCYNPNHPQYHRYGGRGITVCQEWILDADSFISWALSHGWQYGKAIHRIDNDGNYEPNNCTVISKADHQCIHALAGSLDAFWLLLVA